jgi:hypothetical protein
MTQPQNPEPSKLSPIGNGRGEVTGYIRLYWRLRSIATSRFRPTKRRRFFHSARSPTIQTI